MTANLPKSPAANQEQQSTGGNRIRNFSIAIVAIALTIALFLGLGTETPTNTLETLANESTPLEVAIGNGKPTLMEFYANWCTSCQAMAKDMEELKQQYTDKLNFVMLNVDNSKWLPELSRYRVDAIPHFVFLGKDGQEIAQSIGEMPRPVMAADLEALVAGSSLPYTQTTGQVSSFKAPVAAEKANTSDPRSHGSQVQVPAAS